MTTDARSERSHQALVQAGMIMLAENRNASLSEVAQQAGVGRATLYRHFQTREELIRTIAETCVKAFDQATQHIETSARSWLDAVRLMFEAVMPLQNELNYLMRLDALIEEQEILDLFNQQEQEILHIMQQCQAEKSVRQDVSPQWLSALLDGLFFAAWRMVVEHNCPHEEAARLAFESFCHGVKQR